MTVNAINGKLLSALSVVSGRTLSTLSAINGQPLAQGATIWRLARQYMAKPPLGASINWGHPLTSGLVNAFLFNEGGGIKVNDSANASYVGTVAGITLPSWSFDPKEMSISTAGALGPNIQTVIPDTNYLGDLSILWCGAFRVAGTFHSLVFKSALNGATNNPIEFRTENTTPPRLQFVDADALNLNTWTCATTVSVGAHHQLGVSRPASLNVAPTFYVDGVQGAAASGGGSAVTATGTNANLRFLLRADGGSNLDGQITLVYIWRRLLRTDEFQSLQVNPYQFIVPARFH